MATIVEQARQSAADAQKELRRVIVEETDERPALILEVNEAESVNLVRRKTRGVLDVQKSSVEIYDDELADVVTVLTAMKKTV